MLSSKLSKEGKAQEVAENEDQGSEISKKISDGIHSLIDRVVSERKEYYKENPAPSVASLDAIITNTANKNAAISGGAGLIPGPWGMAAAIPEILAVVHNQLVMVYDISKAYGHDIDREVLVSILFGAIGNGAASYLVIQGQKVMAKRAGARALQSLIQALGGKITQQLAKSMAAKWLPVAGAIAMATWSRYSTKKIGENARSVFADPIEGNVDVIPSEIDVCDEESLCHELTSDSSAIDELKILSLINLMKIDGEIDESEMSFIDGFIGKTDLASEKKIQLISLINSNEKITPDFSVLREDPEEKIHFMIDLISLAKADGNFHCSGQQNRTH